ncbi:hypothetical protein C8Q77DRAFT_1090198 [Trametes polyzona]|nr:hypothetical protein C8Q77DRAFT_1090198 [Trametes polyzona]
MLRASSLGLAFTHGISRCYLFPRPRWLHKQLGHEPQPVLSGLPHLHAEKEIEMSTGTPDAVGPYGSSPSLPDPMANTPTTPAPKSHPTTANPSPAAKGPKQNLPPAWRLARYAYRDHERRRPLYEKLVQPTDLDEAWKIYQELLQYRPVHLKHSIPPKYLHAFAAALVKRSADVPPRKERTQTIFLRLLSVLNTLYYSGGQVRLWEWNALIECAGRGWRKTRTDDFQAALNIYQDMVANRAPGSSIAGDTLVPPHGQTCITSKPVEPDVVTYTTLIYIAGRTRDPEVLQVAESYLVSSGIQPNRITFLAFLRYYARQGHLKNVRSVMYRVLEHGWSLGQDGINALIWAYGRKGRLDIAGAIYRILRHQLLPEDPSIDRHAVEKAVYRLQELENITVPADLKPDAITYYTLIQVYAYHGQLRECLNVFADMMTSPVPVTRSLEDGEEFVPGLALPDPILPIFRSIFLGFVRHATPPDQETRPELAVGGRDPHGEPVWRAWTYEQLHTLFGDFVALPQQARPNSRTVYWLLVAFAVTSGNDREVLRSVWNRLESRYGGWWDGRVLELRNKIFAETFDRAYFERLHTRRQRRS